MTGTTCCVPGCLNNTKYNRVVSWHEFPTDQELRKAWIKQINRSRAGWNLKPKYYTKICGIHFNLSGRKTVADKVPKYFPAARGRPPQNKNVKTYSANPRNTITAYRRILKEHNYCNRKRHQFEMLSSKKKIKELTELLEADPTAGNKTKKPNVQTSSDVTACPTLITQNHEFNNRKTPENNKTRSPNNSLLCPTTGKMICYVNVDEVVREETILPVNAKDLTDPLSETSTVESDNHLIDPHSHFIKSEVHDQEIEISDTEFTYKTKYEVLLSENEQLKKDIKRMTADLGELKKELVICKQKEIKLEQALQAVKEIVNKDINTVPIIIKQEIDVS